MDRQGKYLCQFCGDGIKNPSARKIHEAFCARKPGAQVPEETISLKEDEVPDIGITEKDLELRDLRKENADLKGRVQAQGDQLRTQAQEHPRLVGVLDHARTGTCPTCKDDLEHYNEATIQSAIEGLTDGALRHLALERGILPKHIQIAVPER